MAKNNEVKITTAEAKRILDGGVKPQKLVWEGLEIMVRPKIGLNEMHTFVQETINSCFSDGGDYMPDAQDFATRVNLIEKYTNASMPADLKIQYALLYNTDLVDRVMEIIDSTQFDMIVSSIERGVRYRASLNIEGVEQKMNDIYATVMQIIDTFDTKFGEIFGSIDADDMKLIMKGISESGRLDERKIVDAYLASKTEDALEEAPTDLVK